MPRLYACDEAIINGPQSSVFKAILDEYCGMTNWGMPYQESKPRGTIPTNREGAVVDIIIHSERARGTPRFSYTFTKITEPESIELQIAGDIVGKGVWTFEPIQGKTKVRFVWDVKPNRLIYILLSPFIDMAKIHSDVIVKGYTGLNEYLQKNEVKPS